MGAITSQVRQAGHKQLKTAWSNIIDTSQKQSQPFIDLSQCEIDWDTPSDPDSDYEPNLAARKRKAKKQKAGAAKRAKRARTSNAPADNHASSPSTGSKRSVQSEKPFPILSLPAELRLQIYDAALKDDSPVILYEGWKRFRRVAHRMHGKIGSTSLDTRSFSPVLLVLNNQIHDEAAPILYSNDFSFTDTAALYHFLGQTGSHRRFLKKISINQWGHRGTHKAMNHPSLTMLVDAVNLQTLKINCNLHWDWSADAKRTAERFFRDAHNWLEAVGTREKDKLAGLKYMSLRSKEDGEEDDEKFNVKLWRWRNARGRLTDKDDFYTELAKLLERVH